MKKYVLIAAVLAGALVLGGCSGKKKEAEKNEAVVETEAGDKTGSADEEAVSEAAQEAVESMSEEAEEAAEDAISEEIGERPSYTALDYVTVGEYTGLSVQVEDIQITDEQVDEAFGSYIGEDNYEVLTEGTVQMGDTANIDFEGKKDGVAFEGGTSEGYDLVIGSGMFIPGFEEGLVDVKIGDTVDLDLTFPENYGSEELAGADVVFTVKVNSVKRLPELTDELASKVSGGTYTTADAYLEYIREDLAAQAEASQEDQIKNELMTQLYNTCTVDEYPEELVAYSENELKQYYSSYAQSMGMEMADFLSTYFGMDEETFNSQVKMTIESSLQQELILMAIAEKEGLNELSDEEYEAGCARYAEQLGYDNVDDFKSAYDEPRIRTSIIMDAAMSLVRDKAVIYTPEEALTEAVTE